MASTQASTYQVPATPLSYARSTFGSTTNLAVHVLPEQLVLDGDSMPNEGPKRVMSASLMPESSLAVRVTENFLAVDVPTTTAAPPFTVTFVIAVSPKRPLA